MNHRTEIDIALFGYAIQLESSKQMQKPGDCSNQITRMSRLERETEVMVANHMQLMIHKTKK